MTPERARLMKAEVTCGDPVNLAIHWSESMGFGVPFICAANEKRPGGDWETGVVGYEVGGNSDPGDTAR